MSVHIFGWSAKVLNRLHKIAASAVLLAMVLALAPFGTFDIAYADTPEIPVCDVSSFDDFSLGTVNGQSGWSATGAYDQAVVDNTYGYTSFGCKSLRLSNAITSGAFGDQTFAAPIADSVGEVDATAGTFTEGTRRTIFEAEFDIASASPLAQQPGLFISVSPDRGDGSRMSYLGFGDDEDGIGVTFYDVQSTGAPVSFTPTDLGALDRTVPHRIKFVVSTLNGAGNDIVEIWIDGSLVHTGTTWENYYRFSSEASAEQSPRVIKTLILRAGGVAAPATSGGGFLFDNFTFDTDDLETTPPPLPVHTSPANGSIFATGTLGSIDWSDVTDEVSNPVTYIYQSSVSSDTNPDGSFMTPAYTSGALASSEINAAGTPNGTYYWHVRAIDALGNQSAWTDPWQIIVLNGGDISGYKWNDADADGLWGDESVVTGITITLNKIVDDAEVYVGTTTTNAMGYYEFTNLSPGTYVVSEQPGMLWKQTFPANAEGHTVVLEVAEDAVTHSDGNNFGNIEAVSLTGSKFDDLDNDGYWDGVHGAAETTEPGIAGWTISAMPIVAEGGAEDIESGRVSKTAITNQDGEYIFKFIASENGWWRISEQQKENWNQTYPTNETGYYDVYISPTGPLMDMPPIDMASSGFLQTLALLIGADIAHAVEIVYEAHFDAEEGVYEYYDFGNWKRPIIEVAKWNDIDADGVWDDGEPGIEGFTFAVGTQDEINVGTEEEPELQTQTEIIALGLTDADGYAHISVPAAGSNYVVFEEQKSYWARTYPTIARTLDVEPAFAGEVTLYNADGNGALTDEQPTLDTAAFFGVTVSGASGSIAQTGNPGNESVVALQFGNWAYPIIEALKYHDENEDEVRNWTDVTQEGNTDGVKDENELYTENGIEDWPMALGVVTTNILDPFTTIDVQIVDVQLTNESGVAQLHAPFGNEWYVVLEAAQDGWTPVAPSARSETLAITYAEGVEDSYTLYANSFFDLYIETSTVEPLTQGSSVSMLGDKRESEMIEFGNYEEPVTSPSGGGGGGNGQIVGSSGSAPGFFNSGTPTGGNGSSQGGGTGGGTTDNRYRSN